MHRQQEKNDGKLEISCDATKFQLETTVMACCKIIWNWGNTAISRE